MDDVLGNKFNFIDSSISDEGIPEVNVDHTNTDIKVNEIQSLVVHDQDQKGYESSDDTHEYVITKSELVLNE